MATLPPADCFPRQAERRPEIFVARFVQLAASSPDVAPAGVRFLGQLAAPNPPQRVQTALHPHVFVCVTLLPAQRASMIALTPLCPHPTTPIHAPFPRVHRRVVVVSFFFCMLCAFPPRAAYRFLRALCGLALKDGSGSVLRCAPLRRARRRVLEKTPSLVPLPLSRVGFFYPSRGPRIVRRIALLFF